MLSSIAAETGVSPSTASKILQKTRDLFDDPLFVRSGGRILPMERMRELAPGFAAPDLEPYRRATFSRSNPSGGHYLDVLAHTLSCAEDAVLFPQILAAGLALMQTDLILTCPEPMARILAQTTGLFMTTDPERGDCPWTPVLLWHERTHRSPVHVWVRSQLLRYAGHWGEG